MKKNKVKCYVLSVNNGTVQIGHTVFQPCNNVIFYVGSMKDCSKNNMIEVEGSKNMETALKALKLYYNQR